MNKPKIFDPETVEYMKECDIKPQQISKIQYEKMKLHLLEKIETIRKLINQEASGEELRTQLFFSPAGDGMGCDNYCIDFGWDNHGMNEEMDLKEALDTLRYLKEQSHGK